MAVRSHLKYLTDLSLNKMSLQTTKLSCKIAICFLLDFWIKQLTNLLRMSIRVYFENVFGLHIGSHLTKGRTFTWNLEVLAQITCRLCIVLVKQK